MPCYIPRRVDGNTDILGHPVPKQYPLPRGHIVGVIPFVPWPWWQSDLPFPDTFDLKIQGHRSRPGVPQSAQHSVDWFPLCFTSGHPIDSRSFRFMTTGPPIPEIQFDLENSRSKVKVKGTLVSVASSWFISFLFTLIGPTIPQIWQI